MADTATEEKKDIPGLTLTPGFGEGTEWVDGFSGAGMVDTVAGLVKAIQDGNKAAMAAYGVGLGFDVVGAILNPLGALLGAGVGWLIDHLYFLREPLDLLMGDNIAVRQETEKIKEDADKYQGVATSHVEALKKLESWTGATAEAFKKSMNQVADEIEAIGLAMKGSAEIMATMGACVTAFRSLVRDIIAMVIGNLIGGAIVAAGLAPFTFGASIVAYVGVAVATALEAVGRCLRHITNLKSLLATNKTASDQLGKALGKISDDATRLNKGGGTTTPSNAPPVTPPVSKPPEIPGAGGAPKPPDTPPAPPVNKPPEIPGAGGPPPKPPETPPAPPVNKPPEIPGAGGGVKPPEPTTVPAGGAPVSKPPEIPGAGGGAKPPEPTTVPSSAPPVTKPPEVPGAGGGAKPPKPPEPPKPPATQPPKWSAQDIKDFANKIKNGRKDGMEQFGKFGKGKLEAKLMGPPHNKTPQEAADIARWVKNFEEIAAPGGAVQIGGKVFAVGSLLHLAHELWKEMAPDVASRKENEGFMGDLTDYNKTH